MATRRGFLKESVLVGAGVLAFPNQLFSQANKKELKLCVLHTNDWHSRIDPFPMDGGKLQGLGGAAKRAALINQIRKEETNVILLDSGDMFQGTPYFNKYKGELEFKLMSEMGYDAVTLGNHDFDAGLDGLNKQLVHAKFKIVSANYDFSNTLLEGKFPAYTVIEKEGVRIGVFGIGIELKGLVPDELFGETKYQDPILKANETALVLKTKEKCDVIICLSHLGYDYSSDKISDVKLARESVNIDLILGGHTHTFLEKPREVFNNSGHLVIVNQAGWGGVMLGRIDISVNKSSSASKPRSTMLKVS